MEIRTYDPDCNARNFAQCHPVNFASIIERLLRLTVNLVDRNASDIYYEIADMEKRIESEVAEDRILFFCEDGVTGYSKLWLRWASEDTVIKPESAIQIWEVEYNPQKRIVTLQRVTKK